MAGQSHLPPRTPRRTQRLTRLFIGRNLLLRPCDRLEGFLVMLLAALFLAAVGVAPVFGEHLYHSQRAAAAELRPAMAVLLQNGPSDTYLSPNTAAARWRAPDGKQHIGVLTTVTAPGIAGAKAGARVRVWLSGSGQPQAPPVSAAESEYESVLYAVAAVLGTAMLLAICYLLARLTLNRRRLAAWASAWSLTGPHWTARH